MSKNKVVTVKLEDLKVNLFVRQSLDSGRVMYLADLIDNGVQMKDRIKISSDFTLIDGRHRKEAYELCKIKEVEAELIPVDDEVELISLAYQSNTGGALPPTQQDTEHTVALLLDRGVAKKQIGDLLGLPGGLARKYINDVQSRLTRVKLQRAVAAVTEGGLTAFKAAEVHSVELEKLKEALSGAKRKKHAIGIVEIQRMLTTNYKSISQKNASHLRRLIEKYEEGDVTENQVRDIMDHIENLQKQSSRALSDWKKRFASKSQIAVPA
jgi:hypothetical protein